MNPHNLMARCFSRCGDNLHTSAQLPHIAFQCQLTVRLVDAEGSAFQRVGPLQRLLRCRPFPVTTPEMKLRIGEDRHVCLLFLDCRGVEMVAMRVGDDQMIDPRRIQPGRGQLRRQPWGRRVVGQGKGRTLGEVIEPGIDEQSLWAA
ncbi:MAG: hypothetical protein R2867_32885 [Caldilineaceae bacterium]